MIQECFEFDRMSFDAEAAGRLKEQGMERASFFRSSLLDIARAYAREIVCRKGEVSIDDVYRAMIRDRYDVDQLGPAAGSIFRKDFIPTGRWKQSVRISNHARKVMIWRLR